MISVLGYCCCCVDRRSVGVHDQASREKEEDKLVSVDDAFESRKTEMSRYISITFKPLKLLKNLKLDVIQ